MFHCLLLLVAASRSGLSCFHTAQAAWMGRMAVVKGIQAAVRAASGRGRLLSALHCGVRDYC